MAAINHTRRSCGWMELRRQMEEEAERWRRRRRRKERLSTLWLLSALSVATKEQFWQRWLSLSYSHSFPYWAGVCSFQSRPAVPKQTYMSHMALFKKHRLRKQKAIVKKPPVFRSNAAIKISYIANTHSTGLLLTQRMIAQLYRTVTVKGGGNRICWGLIGFTTPWVSWPVSWVRAPNSD